MTKSTESLMPHQEYFYASEKFSSAVYMLATGPGDVRSRLLHAWRGPLWVLTPEHLPKKLRKDFLWIKKQLYKYNEAWPGQIEDLKRKERIDPTFKKKFANHYPDPVEATLGRIKNKTGAEIARRIFNIYDSLESIVSYR